MAELTPALRGALVFLRDAGATSPLYRHLLGAMVDDSDRGGVTAEVLLHADPTLEPVSNAMALRFLGAVHRLVLTGKAPALAAHYPSVGGTFVPEAPGTLTADFLATVAEHRAEIIEGLGRSVQTNEVARSAALLVGYLEVARWSGLPLRVLEIGSSAGFNLRWDHYRYEGGAGGSAWGDEASPLRFTAAFTDPRPDLRAEAEVGERQGCDANPIDPTDPDGALALRSFVWPDQVDRFAALDAAIEVAARVPAPIERADAAVWLDARLAESAPGAAAVVAHSVVWQYLPRATRDHIRASLGEAGARSSRRAPVAWLRMEPGADAASAAEVRLTTWPGGDERVLATAGYHGRPVRLA